MTDIILLATYWNEIEWVEASLQQIMEIDPIEIIICDGNFDSRYDNRSTDGTREIISEFVKKNRLRARMISAVRVNPWSAGASFYFGAGIKNRVIPPSRLNFSLRAQFLLDNYRVNQALTFAKMINLSKEWQVGRWVMSYDADQFYTDELISFFDITNQVTEYDLITADEWTFPNGFDKYTTGYEKRKWNNMPHKIKSNLAVYPTRHFVVESCFGTKTYQDDFSSIYGGVYHHYKFRKNSQRLEDGYSLGDRKPPDLSRYDGLVDFRAVYPKVITGVV
ncbi:MAG: hypothetical protein KUG76_08080 [Gammaproteobacteria bacterium]|nr:hypothetical protein [Gammaproteobacteria bacterium]